MTSHRALLLHAIRSFSILLGATLPAPCPGTTIPVPGPGTTAIQLGIDAASSGAGPPLTRGATPPPSDSAS